MQFVAIDVETANPDMGSICQIGLARFADGQLAEEWCTLAGPEDCFDDVNISIHGIEPRMARGQPKLPQVADRLRRTAEQLAGRRLVQALDGTNRRSACMES